MTVYAPPFVSEYDLAVALGFLKGVNHLVVVSHTHTANTHVWTLDNGQQFKAIITEMEQPPWHGHPDGEAAIAALLNAEETGARYTEIRQAPAR